ncbi:MAG: Uncharacterized protein FD187_3162, partial [bacterium]
MHAAEQDGAEDDVVLAAAAREDQRPGEVAQGGGRDAGVTGLGAQAPGQSGGQVARGAGGGAAVALYVEQAERGARGFDVAQHVAEEGFVRFQGAAVARLGDEFPEGYRGGEALCFALQVGADFFEDHLQGGVIQDHVVGEEQQQAAFAVLCRDDAQQGGALQVDARQPGVAVGDQLGVHRSLGGVEVQGFERERGLAPDDLHRFGQAFPGDGAAQDVVPVYDGLQGGDEGGAARAAVEGQQDVVEVGVVAVLQLVVKQDAFLERDQGVDVLDVAGAAFDVAYDQVDGGLRQIDQRQEVGGDADGAGGDAVGGGRGGRLRVCAARQDGADALGETGDGGGFEEPAYRYRDAERVVDPRGELGGEQGMAAQFEEVVVDAGGILVQDGGPQAGEDFFEGVARSGEVFGCGCGFRFRQGVAVDLAVGGERQPFQDDDGRRHHVARQPCFECGAQGACFQPLSGDVGGQLPFG